MANQKNNNTGVEANDDLGGGMTTSELAALKQKHGKLLKVSVKKTEHEILTGWFKEPDKNIMSNVINRTVDKKVAEAREFLLVNTFVAGDKEITTNPKASIAAGAILYGAISFLETTVEEF